MKVLNRLFMALTAIGLATMLVPLSAHAARNLAVDDKGNLFVADTDSASILKFTSDGKRSTFASGLNDANDMAFDDKGNLFVNSHPMERGARSPPGLTTRTTWLLTTRAISLCGMVTRSSNSRPKE